MAAELKACAAADCNGSAHASAGGRRGFCQTHERRQRLWGDVNTTGRPVRGKCTVSGCEKPHHISGWCKAHHARWKRNGSPTGGRDRMPANGPCGVAGCESPARSKGFCQDHYARLRRHGDPVGGGTERGAPLAWLESHKDHDGPDCLIWPFGSGEGYGGVQFRGRTMTPARAMCFLAHGNPPAPRLHSAHSCGRGHEGCVHPQHLRWATAAENAADKVLHGTDPRSVANGARKLRSNRFQVGR